MSAGVMGNGGEGWGLSAERGGWGGSGGEAVALAEAVDDRADFEAAGLRRPEGAAEGSPGQRPGFPGVEPTQALKGRTIPVATFGRAV